MYILQTVLMGTEVHYMLAVLHYPVCVCTRVCVCGCGSRYCEWWYICGSTKSETVVSFVRCSSQNQHIISSTSKMNLLITFVT